jgi:hypothetical protein
VGEPFLHPVARLAELRTFATNPPDLDLLPKGSLAGVVTYLRRCTGPDDRVFASWFVPELYFFAGRAFAGHSVTTFGDHWSEDRFQRRTAAALTSEPAAVVLVDVASEPYFRSTYPTVVRALDTRYRVVGTSAFGTNGGGYRVLVPADRAAAAVDDATGLPCPGARTH